MGPSFLNFEGSLGKAKTVFRYPDPYMQISMNLESIHLCYDRSQTIQPSHPGMGVGGTLIRVKTISLLRHLLTRKLHKTSTRKKAHTSALSKFRTTHVAIDACYARSPPPPSQSFLFRSGCLKGGGSCMRRGNAGRWLLRRRFVFTYV